MTDKKPEDTLRDDIVWGTVEQCAKQVEQLAELARRIGRGLEPKELLELAAALRSLAPEQPVCEMLYVGNDDSLGCSWMCSECLTTVKEDEDFGDHKAPTGFCPGCGRPIRVKE